MAKEKFERTKPHVNVGTIGHAQGVEGPAGLTVDTVESTSAGNPPESYELSVDIPATSAPELATVVIPLDDDFFFRLETGPAVSLDFSIDVLPATVEGTNDVDVSLAILQHSRFFLARPSSTFDPPSIDGEELQWTSLSAQDLTADEFDAVGGRVGHPDFSQPFQFGYALTSETSSAGQLLELGLDNMVVEITTIPEPSTIGLAVSLGAAYLWHRWRGDDD